MLYTCKAARILAERDTRRYHLKELKLDNKSLIKIENTLKFLKNKPILYIKTRSRVFVK